MLVQTWISLSLVLFLSSKWRWAAGMSRWPSILSRVHCWDCSARAPRKAVLMALLSGLLQPSLTRQVSYTLRYRSLRWCCSDRKNVVVWRGCFPPSARSSCTFICMVQILQAMTPSYTAGTLWAYTFISVLPLSSSVLLMKVQLYVKWLLKHRDSSGGLGLPSPFCFQLCSIP